MELLNCVYIERERDSNSTFNFLRNCQIVFQIRCTSLHSHQQCPRVPVSSYPHKHLLLSSFLVMAILVGVKYIIVVLIYVSLMTSSTFLCAYWSFVYLLWSNVYSDPLPIFFSANRVVFLLLNCKGSLYILNTIPLSGV